MFAHAGICARRLDTTGELYVVIDVPITVTPAEALELAEELRLIARGTLAAQTSGNELT